MKVTPQFDKASRRVTHFQLDGELYLADQAPRDLHNLAGNVIGRLHCVGKLSARGPTYFIEPLTRAVAAEMRFPPGTIFADRVPLSLGDSDSGVLARFTDPTDDAIRFPCSNPISLGE